MCSSDQMQTGVDLEALRQAAEAATPGPWHVVPARPGGSHLGITYSEYPDFPTIVKATEGRDGYGSGTSPTDAHYIAAVNPAVLLELIDRLEVAEKRLEQLAAQDAIFDYRPRDFELEDDVTEQDRREQQAREQYGWA